MARIGVRERQERLLNKLLEKSTKALEDASEEAVEEWINHPLTVALEELVEADILQLQLYWANNSLTDEQDDVSQAKIEVFSQIQDYLESGRSWLEEEKLKREEKKNA
jgi:uncharacterized protein YllA (UPF0747 family)